MWKQELKKYFALYSTHRRHFAMSINNVNKWFRLKHFYQTDRILRLDWSVYHKQFPPLSVFPQTVTRKRFRLVCVWPQIPVFTSPEVLPVHSKNVKFVRVQNEGSRIFGSTFSNLSVRNLCAHYAYMETCIDLILNRKILLYSARVVLYQKDKQLWRRDYLFVTRVEINMTASDGGGSRCLLIFKSKEGEWLDNLNMLRIDGC